MAKGKRQKRGGVLPLVLRALPVLAVVFGVLLLETFLHLEIRACDYRKQHLKSHAQDLKDEIAELRARRAELERMDVMDARAPDLGLVEPSPGQVKLVRVDERVEPLAPGPGTAAWELAQLSGD
jgi:hypothetical protein